MSVNIIQERLKEYRCQNIQEEEQAIREIIQEIALMSLSRNRFFNYAAFHGGTCLRVLYGMNRFSEDLDFLLIKPNSNFKWDPFIKNLSLEFQTYGYQLEVLDKSELEEPVKKVFLKDDSIGKLIQFHTESKTGRLPKAKIRLEIDTNPPEGSVWETKFLDFPLPYSITVQEPASAFALKNHALLCRQYTKGRDWYDFIWLITRKFGINFTLLFNAINQMGPWKNEKITVTKEWYEIQMREKINQLNWDFVKKDVRRFLKSQDLIALDLWNQHFFLDYLEKLLKYLK
jgi:predicted nucleotidyltransferase component of viral defense system